MKRVLGVGILMCLFASAAYADVTVRMVTTGPSMAPAAGRGAQTSEVPATWYIKNGKARVDMVMAGSERSTIFDPAGHQMVMLNPETKEAIVYDLSKIEQVMRSVQAGGVKVSLVPTGQTTKVLGQSCTEYVLTATMSMAGRGNMGPMTVTIDGPVLIAKDAPGAQDFITFYRAAADSGFFSLGGAETRGNPGLPERQSMAAIYRAIADTGGIPYEQHINIKVEGGPMGNMQPPPSVMRVTSVSTDPIPDDRFQIPAGYSRRSQ